MMEFIETKKKMLRVTKDCLVRVEINNGFASITLKDQESEVCIDFTAEDFDYFLRKCRKERTVYRQHGYALKRKNGKK